MERNGDLNQDMLFIKNHGGQKTVEHMLYWEKKTYVHLKCYSEIKAIWTF